MDIFDIHTVKVEKANATLHYRQFRKIARLFRLFELFLTVVLLSWISSRLPFVIRISGEYFRQVFSIVVSPIFIFLVGNVIVLTLVVKSGQLTGNCSSVSNEGSDLYEEIVNNVSEDVRSPVLESDEIVYEDKRIVSELVNNKPIIDNENEIEVRIKQTPNSISNLDPKIYRRTQSENLTKRDQCYLELDKLCVKLKRSETEIGRRTVESPATATAEVTELNDVVDELSNEEFQRKIEGFIARQIRFHQEEKLAIVPHNNNTLM